MNEPVLHRCYCGSKAEVWRLATIGGYQIRCTEESCGNKTGVHLSEEYAAEVWNNGEWKGEKR